jgi:Tfp pilus assembly protein PilF
LLLVGSASLAGCDGPSTAHSRPTFTQDVAPIIFEHCSPCHRPGQAAPFALLNYQDVRLRAAQIATATGRRRMPPWLPEPGYGHFSNERRLRSDQIDLIQQWVQQGAIEGDASDLPAAPAPPKSDDWQLGQPDLVVEMPRAYTLEPGHHHDVFRNFVVPLGLPSTRFVRAAEFHPGNRSLVHHAVIGIDRTRLARRLDEQDPEPGYGERLSEGVQTPDGHFVGWTPGKVPSAQPADLAWRLERGTDLVMQLHLLPSDRQETIQARVGLFFTDTPPTRTPVLIKLGSKTIDIPAGEAAYTITDGYVLPADVDVLTVYPHAHYLAKDMKGVATLPDGTTKWLIWIKDWDFNWQDEYRYAEPVFLPKGTTVTMRYVYDNSANNSRNPHRPPERVRYGPHSSDEMGDLLFQVVPRKTADALALAKDQRDREALANIARGEQLLKTDPDDAEALNWLAASYLTVGRIQEAIEPLNAALRLRPAYAEAHYNLGGALQAEGRLADAIREFRQAVRLRPADDRAHLKLANVLTANSSWAEAILHYERTLAINPDSAEAHNNFGVALNSQRKLAEAVDHFRQALAIRPDYAEVHNNLGVVLGSLGQPEEAADHFRRALEIRPDQPDVQQNLKSLKR